ncbi:MAG: hypothetical protein G01um101466_91 [Parcubacteria group bacterium Gr01-1014_66]|nr:MAG: hypothetical protein G01um101466_91 [Parcubacteria group bacterium Gr01-1014_66]
MENQPSIPHVPLLEPPRSFWQRIKNAFGQKEPLRLHEKIILGILILFFLFTFYVTLDANKYRATVRVIEGEGRVGINPTTEALDFGDLSPGTSAVRRVALSNQTPIPMLVVILKTGTIASLIKNEKNFFALTPRTEDQIDFSLYMPASGEIDRVYDGRVYLFKIPKPF